jgi:hypothetical protein
MEQKLNLHNRYDIEVVDSRTGKMRQKAQAENIILDGAWGQILNNTYGSWFDAIAYGTGTGTMSAARTALFAPLSSKVATDSVYTLDNANNYVSHRQKIVILENEHVGAQLSEVGIMSSRSGTPLCTHALLKDMNGNPVVITKTDTDIITIYATVYLLIGTAYSPTSVLDIARCDPEENGIVRTLLGRPIGTNSTLFTGFNFVFSAVQGTQIISNEGDAYTSAKQVATLDVPNKRARFYYRVPAADANVGGFILGAIKSTTASVTLTDHPSIITRFTPGGLTQAQVVEQIGVGDGTATDFATSFAHIPPNTVVKVDGVPASPTIMADMPNQSVINGFFREVSENPNIQNKMPLFNANINVDVVWENMSNHPVTSIQARGVNISVSNDGVTFTQTILAFYGTETQEVPEEYQGHKYWKISPRADTSSRYIYNIYSDGFSNYKNVRFAVAPANGAVITAEYTPLCAAKDVNHVLDIDITIQLGEHVD